MDILMNNLEREFAFDIMEYLPLFGVNNSKEVLSITRDKDTLNQLNTTKL